MRRLAALVVVGLAGALPASALGATSEGWIDVWKYFGDTIRPGASVISSSPQSPYGDCGTGCGSWNWVFQWDTSPPTVTMFSDDQSGWQIVDWTSPQGGDPCEGHPGGMTTCQITPVAGGGATQTNVYANYRDAGPPTAGAVSGVSPNKVYRRTVTITPTGSDQQTSIAASQLLINGSPIGSPSLGSHPYATPAGVGMVQVSGRVFDESGNQDDGPPTTLKYDNVAPTASITSPKEGDARAAGDLTVEFNASDASGVLVACAVDGGGFGACTSGSRHVIRAPALGSHTFRLRATDSAGNVTEVTRHFRVVPVTIPPIVVIDQFPKPVIAAPQEVPATVETLWSVRGGRTRILKLAVRNVPAGGQVQARCHGHGCPLRRKSFRVKGGKAKLTRAFKHARLGAGAVLEVRVTAPGFIGKVVRYRFRDAKLPKASVLCLAQGASKPTAC